VDRLATAAAVPAADEALSAWVADHLGIRIPSHADSRERRA
jgi:hypothetical protein